MESLNKNGVSITQTPGEEKYLQCCLGVFRGHYYQYDYRLMTICFQHWLKRLKNVTDNEMNG